MIELEHYRLPEPDFSIPENPIFVTGHARAGTTVVTSALHVCGAFMGPTSNPDNPFGPTGVAENPQIRGLIVKPYLKAIGADPFGQVCFPEPEDINVGSAPILKEILKTLLQVGGYQGGPFGYKDAKLSHIFWLFHTMYPDAQWLIVSRRKEDVIRSCTRTNFMNRMGVIDWSDWYDVYEAAKNRMRQHADVLNITEINTNDLLQGDISALEPVVEKFGLTWRPELIPPLIKPRKAV